MANQPVIRGIVKITVKDINNNSVAKTFNNVTNVNIDYNDGTINIVDSTGSFTFGIVLVTTFTYTIVTGLAGSHSLVIS